MSFYTTFESFLESQSEKIYEDTYNKVNQYSGKIYRAEIAISDVDSDVVLIGKLTAWTTYFRVSEGESRVTIILDDIKLFREAQPGFFAITLNNGTHIRLSPL